MEQKTQQKLRRDLLANQTVFQCCILLSTLHHHEKTSFLTAFSKCWEAGGKKTKKQTTVRKITISKKILLSVYYSIKRNHTDRI